MNFRFVVMIGGTVVICSSLLPIGKYFGFWPPVWGLPLGMNGSHGWSYFPFFVWHTASVEALSWIITDVFLQIADRKEARKAKGWFSWLVAVAGKILEWDCWNLNCKICILCMVWENLFSKEPSLSIVSGVVSSHLWKDIMIASMFPNLRRATLGCWEDGQWLCCH